jgi:Reverse transcriptase (RNA-dependent DNA polymerase)/Endonuclease-reverse transcriptase
VLYWNVGGLKGKTFDFYSSLAEIDPDIFCFTETWHTRTYTNNFFSNYNIVEIFGKRSNLFGRYSLGSILGIRKGLPFKIEEKNEYFYIVKTEAIFVCCAYIPPSHGECLENLFLAIDNLGQVNDFTETDFIMLGDFNSRIGLFDNVSSFNLMDINCEFKREAKDVIVNKQGKQLISKITAADLKVLNGNSISDSDGNFTFVNSNGQSTIDLGLASRDAQICDFQVLGMCNTNHFPIMVKLNNDKTARESSGISTVSRIIWDSTKTNDFQHELISRIDSSTMSVNKIVENIFEAAAKCEIVKVKKLNGKIVNWGPSWFDKICREKKKFLRKALRWFRKQRNKNSTCFAESRTAFLNAKSDYKLTCKEKRELYYANIHAKLLISKNSKDFYGALNIFRNQRFAKQRGQIEIDIFKSFFENVYFTDDILIHENLECINSDTTDEELDKDFSITELDCAIKKLSKGKAPGSDGIPNEVLKALPAEFKDDLLININEFYKERDFPENWSEMVIAPIFKKGNPDMPSNYRPITLANTILKLFTLMLTNRLLPWCNKNNVISENQAAYKRGTGCQDHVFVLNAIIQKHIQSPGAKVYALFVDLSQAFDTVVHNKLWGKLIDKGLSTKFIGAVKGIYRNATAKVRTNYGISENFDIGKGVLQGETLSPILFTMYLEDLVQDFENSDTIPLKMLNSLIHILLYADDIVILAHTPAELQKKVNILREYFARHNLRVNLGKTNFMIFAKRRSNHNFKLFWNDKEIERVTTYMYLGVPFSETPNFQMARNHFVRKSKAACHNLEGLLYKSKMKTFEAHIKLYRSMVRSVLSYCAPTWGLKYMENFEKSQSGFLKSIFKLPRLTPGWFVRLETCVQKNELFFVRLVLNFWQKLINKPKDSIIYNCYQDLKNLSSKYNWYDNLKSLLAKWNIDYLLSLDTGKDTDLEKIGDKVFLALRKISSDSLSEDIKSMRESSLLNMYSKNKTHYLYEQIWDNDCIWTTKQMLLQLRLGLPHLTYKGKVVRLNSMLKLYGVSEDENCQLCGGLIEDIYHLIFECAHFKNYRTLYLTSISDTRYTRDNYLIYFKNITKQFLLNLYHFINATLHARSIYYDLMESVNL